MMSQREKAALDRYITGNYGEDQLSEDDEVEDLPPDTRPPQERFTRTEDFVDAYVHDLRSLVRRYFPTYPTDQRGMDLLQAICEDERCCINDPTIPFIWEKLS